MKVICDSHIPFIKGVLEPYCDVAYVPGQDIGPETVRDADALIIRTRTRCDRLLLDGSRVRFIATATIGYDHIDTRWCESHGISWTNAPGCNSRSVEQYMGSLLATMSQRLGFECREKTLGVIGVGNVGSKVARLAALMGFNVVLCDPPRAIKEGNAGFLTLDELIERSDIITCHVPLNYEGRDATYHLIDKEKLNAMNGSQILINTSRGEVVDSTALKKALRDKTLGAAALDVWENEPGIDQELMDLLFCATPHIAGYSTDGKATGTTMCVQALGDFFELPCREWEVTELPSPPQTLEFGIDTQGLKPQEVLAKAILHTYDIMQDDASLRDNPAAFETLRSGYHIRREFTAFTVKPLNDDTGRASAFLREAGFNISE